MGLEHLGVVIGGEVDEFSRVHRAALTGQQFQSPYNEPYYVLFEDFTHVKFYRRSLRDVCELEGARFESFQHDDDWVPQRRPRSGPAAAMTSESVPEPPVPDLDLRWPARTVGDGLPLAWLVLIEPDAGELPCR